MVIRQLHTLCLLPILQLFSLPSTSQLSSLQFVVASRHGRLLLLSFFFFFFFRERRMSHVYYESRELCCLVIHLEGINEPARSFFFGQTGNRSPVVPTPEGSRRLATRSPTDTDLGFSRASHLGGGIGRLNAIFVFLELGSIGQRFFWLRFGEE